MPDVHNYRPGDVVSGYRLGADHRWHEDARAYRPGDVVNGYRLGTDHQWHPCAVAPATKRDKATLWVLLVAQLPFMAGYVWMGWFTGGADCSAMGLTPEQCADQEAFASGLAALSLLAFWMLANIALVGTIVVYRRFGDRVLP